MRHLTMIVPAAALVLGAALAPAAAVRAQGGGGSGFRDVPDSHWAAAAVKRVREAGIMAGYPNTAQAAAATTPRRPAAAASPFNGNKPVTRYELAVTLYRFIQYVERADRQKKGRTSGASAAPPTTGPEAVRRLIREGYLPAGTPLAREGGKRVTAGELADALAQVLVRVTEKKTPVSPDSQNAPIDHPHTHAPGG